MKIIDLDGREIIVTDLAMKIMQTDDYRHYRVQNPSSYQLHLYNYWEDLYEKRLILEAVTKTRNQQG